MDAVACSLLVWAAASAGAVHTTSNFVVTAPTAEFAQEVGEAAEIYRKELAVAWIGKEMPRWSSRCPIQVKVGSYGAGGSTTFQFDRGEVYGWNMKVQGTAERILDSVLPHEINHTVFACYFRRPLPRWADEGAASLIEHESERLRLKKIHEQVMNSTKKIPLRQLLGMKEYPTETQQVLTMYAEGYSLADYLIQQSSRQRYLQFLSKSFEAGWDRALEEFYGYKSIDLLEQELDQWILAGSPALNLPAGSLVASRRAGVKPPSTTIRGQSPEWPIELGEPGDWPRRWRAEPRNEGSEQVAVADNAPRQPAGNAERFVAGRQSRDRLTAPQLKVPASGPTGKAVNVSKGQREPRFND